MSTELVREVAPVALQTQSHYTIKRPWFSFFERTFRVFTNDGQLIMVVKHPVFKLREEFKVFADEAKTRPLLLVKSKQVIAINFSYDVSDARCDHIRPRDGTDGGSIRIVTTRPRPSWPGDEWPSSRRACCRRSARSPPAASR